MPGWIRRTPLFLPTTLFLLTTLLAANPCHAVDFSLIWYTVDGGGGGILTGSGYEMSATTGQFDIGSMSGGGYTLQLGSSGSGPIATAIDPPPPGRPFVFRLHPNTPNPFNPATRIAFELPSDSMVRLEIFTVRGQRVRTLVNVTMTAGPHHVDWQGQDDRGKQLASGVYFVELRADGLEARHKLTLLK